MLFEVGYNTAKKGDTNWLSVNFQAEFSYREKTVDISWESEEYPYPNNF